MEFTQSMMPTDLFDRMVLMLLRTKAGEKMCDIPGLLNHLVRYRSSFSLPTSLAVHLEEHQKYA